MLALAGNIVIVLAIAGAVVGAVALFWIARQDGSPQGRNVAILILLTAAIVELYVSLGHHWF